MNCEQNQFCPYYHSPEEKYQFMIYEDAKERDARINDGYESDSEEEVKQPKEKKIELPQGEHYIYKAVISYHEDKHTEFKSATSQNFLSYAIKVVIPYVCAFLNSQGGILYYGIADHGEVVGVCLDRQSRDLFLRQLDQAINSFTPHIAHDKYVVKFISIYYPNRVLKKDYYVIEIHISEGEESKIYFTGKNEAFIRRNASLLKLTGKDLISAYESKKKGNS